MVERLRPSGPRIPGIGHRGYYYSQKHLAYVPVQVTDYVWLDGRLWFKIRQLLKGPTRWVSAHDIVQDPDPSKGSVIVKTQ